MTEFLKIGEGEIAYDVTGGGPLVVMVPGMGDSRRAYRFLASALTTAGYRVATMDLRGHGESSLGWDSYTRTDTANDIVALIEHLGEWPSSSGTRSPGERPPSRPRSGPSWSTRSWRSAPSPGRRSPTWAGC